MNSLSLSLSLSPAPRCSHLVDKGHELGAAVAATMVAERVRVAERVDHNRGAAKESDFRLSLPLSVPEQLNAEVRAGSTQLERTGEDKACHAVGLNRVGQHTERCQRLIADLVARHEGEGLQRGELWLSEGIGETICSRRVSRRDGAPFSTCAPVLSLSLSLSSPTYPPG